MNYHNTTITPDVQCNKVVQNALQWQCKQALVRSLVHTRAVRHIYKSCVNKAQE